MATTKRYVDFSGSKEIHSLSEAFELISNLYSEWNITKDKSLWYRGQTDFVWSLTPGIYRRGFSSEFEREAIRDFKLHAPRFLKNTPSTELGWISLMQHYGLPTRLLDWSESYLTALFFAVQSYGGDAALWVIRPAYLNKEALGEHSILIETDDRLDSYILPHPNTKTKIVLAEFPAAFRPEWNSIRIAAQKGAFTIHGNKKTPLEDVILDYDKAGKNMQGIKIRIPEFAKETLMQELRIAGVTDLLLFPEMDGLCKEISRKYLR